MQASGRNLGMVRVFQVLLREEGIFRFWKGAHVMASGCIPAHACYFTCYEHLKLWMGYNNEEFNLMKTAMIGASTTFVHDFFIAPADVVKQRLQLCRQMTAS